MATHHDLISEKKSPEMEAEGANKTRDVGSINGTEAIEGSAVTVGDELTIFERKAALINA